MRTLSTELSAWIDRQSPGPRVYADANVPAPVVAFMRQTLGWDVFFVLEHDDLRRARDIEHYRLASQMHRTLVTLDHDYFDDHRFPPGESGGVIVVSAPDDYQLTRVLRRVDRHVMRARPEGNGAMPLNGRKLHAHLDWPERPPAKRRRR